MLRSAARVALVASLPCANVLFGQVEVRQATPKEAAEMERGPASTADIEVKNPMLLEFEVVRPNGSTIFRPVEAPHGRPVTLYMTSATKKYVCDRARVETVLIEQTKPATRKRPPQYEIVLSAISGWYRQDIDATVRLSDASGAILAKGFWNDETIGNDSGLPYAGGRKFLRTPFKPTPEQHARLTTDTKPLKLSILIEIQGEEGDATGN